MIAVALLALAVVFWLMTRSAPAPDPERSMLVEQRGSQMTVVKVLELVGESPNSWDEAVQNAVAEAARTIDNITGVEVANWTANVQDGRLTEYKANVKVAFAVDNSRRSR